jgi:hypothetical protein
MWRLVVSMNLQTPTSLRRLVHFLAVLAISYQDGKNAYKRLVFPIIHSLLTSASTQASLLVPYFRLLNNPDQLSTVFSASFCYILPTTIKMRFNLICASAALFAVAVSAVPVEKVVVVRSDPEACPAPHPAPAPAPAQPSSNPPPQQTAASTQQCSAGTGPHCCDTVDSTNNSDILNQLTAAGVDHNTATQKGQVGLTCKIPSEPSIHLKLALTDTGTPITTSLIDALNGNTCTGQITACCENNPQVCSMILFLLYQP